MPETVQESTSEHILCVKCTRLQAPDQFCHLRTAAPVKTCLSCRKSISANKSRSKSATATLHAAQVSPAKAAAPKRTATEAELSPPQERVPITLTSRVPPPRRLNVITDELLATGLSESQARSRAPAAFAQQDIRRDHRAARRDGQVPSPTPRLSALEARLERINAELASSPSPLPRLAPSLIPSPLHSSAPTRAPSPNPASLPSNPTSTPLSSRMWPPPAEFLRRMQLQARPSRSFDIPEPPWEQDLDAPAVDEQDEAIIHEFWDALEAEKMEYCSRCKQQWFDMRLRDGICKRCTNKDKKRRTDEPFFYSDANKLDFGADHNSYGLPALSMAEELLISRVHVAINVLQVRGQQYKYRGHIVQFFRNVGKVYSQLPLLPSNLEVLLIRPPAAERNLQHDVQFRKRFMVRRSCVRQWLEFLRVNHPLYRGFEWNHAALDQLPENGDILDQIQITEASENPNANPAQGPVAEHGDDDEGEEISALPNMAHDETEMERLETDLDAEQNRTTIELLSQRDPSDAHFLSMPTIRRTPINEFNRSQALYSLAFPTLFPCGRAEFILPRARDISLDEWAQHALRWHDGRFARHPTFRFILLNTLMRNQAFRASKYFVANSSAERQDISREDLLEALRDQDQPEARALLHAISRAAVTLKGTRPFWYRKRRECEAFAYCLGVPAAFFTASPADLHWRSLFQHMPQFEEWLSLPEKDRVRLSRRLLKENPHIAAWNFVQRNRLLRDIVFRKKFGLSDFWHRFEFQNRGSPHSHGLYWFDSSPAPDMESEEGRLFFARLWGNHITAVNPEPHRSQDQDEGNPLSVRPQDHPVSFRRLSQIVNRCQRHMCTQAYCLRVNRDRAREAARNKEPAPPPECRFLFPFAICDSAKMIKRVGRTFWSFLPQRNDSFLNSFSRIITLAWGANTDFSPCTSVKAVIAYAAKYTTKIEVRSETFGDMASQILPNLNSAKPMQSFVSKLMNKLIGERDYSAQEVCHILLGLPLQEDSRVTLHVDCRPVTKQNNQLHIGTEGVSTNENLYQKYLGRDITVPRLADLSFFSLISNWNSRGQSIRWKPRPRAKERVLNYYPRYNSSPHSLEYQEFCRVKLMLSHPHQAEHELLIVDEQQFDSYSSAYAHCRLFHVGPLAHPDNHYGIPIEADEEEFEEQPYEEPELEREPWQDMALMFPNRAPALEDINLLGRRDIDLHYDWSPHIGRFTDSRFRGGIDGTYWREVIGQEDAPAPEWVPPDARDTLNDQQRLVYDTVIGHSQQVDPDQLLLQVDGGGGTGKSYLIKILTAHLRQAQLRDPVAITAPTGAASSNIRGKTIHSFLRLPVNTQFEPLSNTALASAQKRLRGLKYLIIDEKSMLGLRTLGWISMRLSQIFPHSDLLFGGINVLLIGDFFQLPPVGQKPLFTSSPRGLKDAEMLGFSAYQAFTRSVFLSIVQRQRGDDQAGFRQALEEMRTAQVSVASFELLSTRVAATLPVNEVAQFDDSLRIYSTKLKVRQYNYEHSTKLNSPIIEVKATHHGGNLKDMENTDAEKVGNLHARLPLCQGLRIMLTRNISPELGLVNGSQGEVFDIGWAIGDDPTRDPPLVVMAAFDDYTGRGFEGPDGQELRNSTGRKVVPILRVRNEFQLGSVQCTRDQFPLTVAYAITVHKAQGITLNRVVVGITVGEFASGLNYVACSRSTSIQGLLIDVPFPRSAIDKALSGGLKAKINDRDRRLRDQVFRDPPFPPLEPEAALTPESSIESPPRD